MSYIGIGSPIPDISSLPGQTGGEVEVNLSYPSAAVCSTASDQIPTFSPAGGSFSSSSPSNLVVNNSSGVIDISESTAGSYTITYTVEGVPSSFAFTINQQEQSTFSYSASSFQQIGTATPTLASGTTAGGDFSASTGVVINTSTGVIDLAASTIGGPYTITYTTPGACSTSSPFTLSITAVSVELIDNSFAMEFNGVDDYISAADTETIITNFRQPWSVSWWAKWTYSASFDGFWQFGTTSSVDNTNKVFVGCFLDSEQGKIAITHSYDGSGSTVYRRIGSGLNDGNWHHFVFTGTGAEGNFTAYIDGSSASGDGTTLQTNFGDSTMNNIGRTASLTSRFFNGDIDEVAIWSRALQTTDIQRIYNATANNPGKTANLFTAGLNTGLAYWNRMGD